MTVRYTSLIFIKAKKPVHICFDDADIWKLIQSVTNNPCIKNAETKTSCLRQTCFVLWYCYGYFYFRSKYIKTCFLCIGLV